MAIKSFRDEYFFLSNFFSRPVLFEGIIYNNNECAFQAQKTDDLEIKKSFCNKTPSQGKYAGRRVKLRSDWEDVKIDIMKQICKAKFDQNLDLKQKLINTGDEELEEGNTWRDTFWGTCNGKGKNHLGIILMEIRDEYRNLECTKFAISFNTFTHTYNDNKEK